MTSHRRRVRHLAQAGAAAVLLVLAVPGAALAADEVSIDHIESEGQQVSVVVSVDGLPGDSAPSVEDVEVAVEGRAVEPKVKTLAAGDIDRSTLLVLDASNSMRGAKFDAARTAITTFLDAAPDDVQVGLVTFAGEVSDTIGPTTDHEAIRTALAETSLGRGTRVYDGIDAAMEALGDDGSRSMLVLSDGADTGSDNTLEVLSREAADSGVVVDVVSLSSAQRADELAGLAEATEGKVIPADPSALTQVFTEQANDLAHQLLITFDAPDDVSDDASIDVTLTSEGQTYHDAALVTLAGTAASLDVVDSGRALISKPVMLFGAAALALGLAGLLVTVLTGATDSRSSSERRLDAYFNADAKQSGQRRNGPSKADLKGSAVALTDRVVSADLETRISQRLTGAGSALTAAEWVLVHAGIAVGSGMLGFLFGGAMLAAIGLLLGVALPWVYLKFRHRRRLSKFNANLAQTLGLMAGGLQAGLSLPQAVDTVVKEGTEPVAGEFRRALVEQRLGIDITDALEGIGQRMESKDFAWVVMAIRIQREVGGNLAEILHTVSDTLREREYLRRQVKALSAEGRMSAWILGGLPVGMFGYMLLANRKYVEPLYTTGLGWILLAAALMLLGLGSFMMAKLAKVEV